MVRNYKRRTSQHRWEEENMANAVNAVRDGRMRFQRAADTFSISMVTLYRRVKKEGTQKNVSKKKVGRLKKAFTYEQENNLQNIAFFIERRLCGAKPM
jgi:transposase-like protein